MIYGNVSRNKLDKGTSLLFQINCCINDLLRKIIIDAERAEFKTELFYHRCVLKDNISQLKLKSL